MLLLASTSPRRIEILRASGLHFALVRPGPEIEGRGDPAARAGQRARSKAEGAEAGAPGDLVLGVDTVVELDGVEVGKPADRAQARAGLLRMAGREHRVHTAHCLVAGAPEQRTRVPARLRLASATVRCRALTEAEIEAYLDTDEWRDKAGGYGIQGAAAAFQQLVAGDLDTVIGLSMAALRALLAEAGRSL